MLEFRSRRLKFKYNDEAYELDFPSIQKLMDYEKAQKKDPENSDKLFEFLESLGLDQDVSRSMEIQMVTTIMQEFNKEKK